MTQNSGSSSSLLVFVAGIALGAVVSALYAPTTGKALRRRIGQAAEDGADMAQDALNQADEFVQDKSDAAKKMASRSAEAFRRVRDEAASAAE